MASRRNALAEPLRLMRSLNLFGLDFLDPIVLAALVDERPLLLIGPHGTAKSELLNRLAAALGLAHRHYNASLISFDDLLGYPVPELQAAAVRYLRTPGDLWDAESVFLDEISRCRPETQNKLFSVVHEKRVQGMALPRLRYRWAAMNPPLTAEIDLDDAYTGSQPLDPALADRFSYVVELPSLLDLPPEERLALIRDGGRPVEAGSAAHLQRLLASAREAAAAIDAHEHAWAANYVGELVPLLAEAQLPLSGRRAVMLAGSIASVRAASLALGSGDRLPDCALAALRAGLPQRGQGRRIESSKLSAIHRSALKTVGEPASGPWRRILTLRDPVARVAEALRHAGGLLDRAEISNLVSEAYASLTVPRRYLFARHVLPRAAALQCLTVPAYELLAEPLGKLVDACGEESLTFQMPRNRMPEWQAILKRAQELARGGPNDAQLANILLTLAAAEQQWFDADELIALDREWQALFAPAEPAADAGAGPTKRRRRKAVEPTAGVQA
jgi:MoxR-like ATPase